MRRKAYDKGRSCEGCGSKMPPHFPRKRREGDGPLLCNSCLTKGAAKVASNPREWYQVGQTWAIDLTNDGHAEVYHLNDGKWGWDVWGPNDADGGTSATRGQAMTDALIAAHELGASFIGSKTASSWTSKVAVQTGDIVTTPDGQGQVIGTDPRGPEADPLVRVDLGGRYQSFETSEVTVVTKGVSPSSGESWVDEVMRKQWGDRPTTKCTNCGAIRPADSDTCPSCKRKVGHQGHAHVDLSKTAYTEEYPREPGKTYILHFKVQPWSTSESAWNFGSRDEVGRFLRRNVVIPSVLMEVDEELPLGKSEVGPFRGREVWPLPRDPRFSSRKVAQWPSRVTGYCVTGDHDSCSGVVYYDAGQWNHDVEGPCQCSCHGTTGSRKVAHDSGDGETIYHCPFCGAGQVIGRSDGTAQCEFCDTAFTVQVQPSMSAVPQTIDGEPHVHPEMPGGEPGEFEDGKDQQPEETEMELEGDEVDDSIDSPKPNPFTSKESARYYRVDGESEAVVDEEAYIRHLAIKFSDDRDAAIEAVRVSRVAGFKTLPDGRIRREEDGTYECPVCGRPWKGHGFILGTLPVCPTS